MLCLLPHARSTLLHQLYIASNGRELLPLGTLTRLLWLPDEQAAEACAQAHGIAVEEAPGGGRGVRLKQPGFRSQPEKAMPPLPPAALARWYGDGSGDAVAVLRGMGGGLEPG
jgi:hypothetical protein